MRIGIKLEDGRFDGVDISHPENGNPGVGGTTYEEILLARSLQMYYSNREIEVVLYHTNDKNRLPEGLQSHRVNALQEIPRAAKEDEVDLLIFSCGRREEWYRELDQLHIACVAWAHCYLNSYEVKYLRKYSCVKRIVFVGREQYSAYIADDIIEKSTFIYNMIGHVDPMSSEERQGKRVVYLGSINRDKGFHVLAKAWKDVLRQEPNAVLDVLGSGKLYGRSTLLGKYGVATADYEKRFMKYVTDEEGNILPSVRFRGIVGGEKKAYLQSSRVGVANPTGRTETFCISAVEMEANGTPVCTTGKYGLLDTVVPEETGLFSDTAAELAGNIVKLLRNPALAAAYGSRGHEFVKQFQAERICDDWVRLFRDIAGDVPVAYVPPVIREKDQRGRVKRLLHSVRIEKGHRWVPAMTWTEFLFQGMWRVFIRDTLYHFLPPPEPMQD